MNLKNILKVDSLEKDCLYLGMIQNNYLIYVSVTGRFTFIDLKNKKINHGNTGLKNIQYVTMTRNGRYIALCCIDENNIQNNLQYVTIKNGSGQVYEFNSSGFLVKINSADENSTKAINIIYDENEDSCCKQTKRQICSGVVSFKMIPHFCHDRVHHFPEVSYQSPDTAYDRSG